MRVRITAKIAYETELRAEHYENVKNGPKTDDEIIAWETAEIQGEGGSTFIESLFEAGKLSDVKIEKLEAA